MENYEGFEGLDECFNIDNYDNISSNTEEIIDEKKEIIDIQNEVKIIEEKKEKIISNMSKIDDSDYLEYEIKSLLTTSKKMLDRLDKDIRIGSGPRMYEVYSSMVNSITSQIKELRQLHEANAKLTIDSKKTDIVNMNQNDKISLTTNQLLDMVINAKENSQLKTIDATFEIEDEMDI